MIKIYLLSSFNNFFFTCYAKKDYKYINTSKNIYKVKIVTLKTYLPPPHPAPSMLTSMDPIPKIPHRSFY